MQSNQSLKVRLLRLCDRYLNDPSDRVQFNLLLNKLNDADLAALLELAISIEQQAAELVQQHGGLGDK